MTELVSERGEVVPLLAWQGLGTPDGRPLTRELAVLARRTASEHSSADVRAAAAAALNRTRSIPSP
jgi:hypothetical protein